MKIELIKDVVSYIAGLSSIDIVNLLYGKENVNEFLIAKKLNVTINQARNILYKLADEGLVSFIRKKDKKNGGWYTYFWTLDVGKSLLALKRRLILDIDNLERQLTSKQTKQFYYCPNCDIEMTEENALLYDFTCPECGEVFQIKDNTKHIMEINSKVLDLKKRLSEVEQEIDILRKKEEASKERKRKIEEKKKKAERELKRKARERMKKREARSQMKKGVRKKPVKKKKKPKKKVKGKIKKKGRKKIVKKRVRKVKKAVKRKEKKKIVRRVKKIGRRIKGRSIRKVAGKIKKSNKKAGRKPTRARQKKRIKKR